MDVLQSLLSLWHSTGLYNFTWQNGVMLVICFTVMYLGIRKQFEPLLLVPISFGGILANIPFPPDATSIIAHTVSAVDPATGHLTVLAYGGFLGQVFDFGINSGIFPLLIFIGVGAMTDFGPLIANPKTAFLGGAAQLGIFTTVIGAVLLSKYCPWITFTMKDAASIGIIGGADGPTSIFLASRLGTPYIGAIVVAAYSYMALVPIIQPPIMRWLTTAEERAVKMEQLRNVSKREKILFPLTVLFLCMLFLPDATPLMGALCFGNLIRESGVTERLSKTAQNELINIVTILLGLSVGSKLSAEQFLTPNTIGILVLGLLAFSFGTAGGVLLAKLFYHCGMKINPLIGAAGVSAVPMAARVVNKVGQEENPQNFLLMHAMGPNVSGVIGSAVAAGILLAICGRM